MNVPGTIRYTASFTNVGVGPTSLSLTGPAGPFVRGKILRIEATLVGGPATYVTFRLKEGAAGRVILEYTLEGFPVAKQPLPANYVVTIPSDLKLEIETDDGTNLTNIDFDIDIEGPT